MDLNNSDDFILLPGDGIEVSYYENIHEGVHSITLSGEIKNPGKYTIKKGEKISPTTTIGSKTALKRLKSFPESLKT